METKVSIPFFILITIKQASPPLLFPYLVADLVAGVASYNFLLRFVELYWIGPLVQNRSVYASVESLWIDFWCCLRIFPKPAKKDTAELKKGQVKVYEKDKVTIFVKVHVECIT